MPKDFYRVPLTVDAGSVARVLYAPLALERVQWAFFFDSGAIELELLSVQVNALEQLCGSASACHFVFSIVELVLPSVRAGDRAVIAFTNPTPEPLSVSVWIGELNALREELNRQRN
jgi:hypothetical protein